MGGGVLSDVIRLTNNDNKIILSLFYYDNEHNIKSYDYDQVIISTIDDFECKFSEAKNQINYNLSKNQKAYLNLSDGDIMSNNKNFFNIDFDNNLTPYIVDNIDDGSFYYNGKNYFIEIEYLDVIRLYNIICNDMTLRDKYKDIFIPLLFLYGIKHNDMSEDLVTALNDLIKPADGSIYDDNILKNYNTLINFIDNQINNDEYDRLIAKIIEKNIKHDVWIICNGNKDVIIETINNEILDIVKNDKSTYIKSSIIDYAVAEEAKELVNIDEIQKSIDKTISTLITEDNVVKSINTTKTNIIEIIEDIIKILDEKINNLSFQTHNFKNNNKKIKK